MNTYVEQELLFDTVFGLLLQEDITDRVDD